MPVTSNNTNPAEPQPMSSTATPAEDTELAAIVAELERAFVSFEAGIRAFERLELQKINTTPSFSEKETRVIREAYYHLQEAAALHPVHNSCLQSILRIGLRQFGRADPAKLAICKAATHSLVCDDNKTGANATVTSQLAGTLGKCLRGLRVTGNSKRFVKRLREFNERLSTVFPD